MLIRKAIPSDAETIHRIVQNTVKEIYPNYYPREVVDFFLNYHSPEIISSDIAKGNVYLIQDRGEYIATGGIYQDNYISRLYVLPGHQGKGYGSALMELLEKNLSEVYDTALLEASLPSYDYYLKLGYQPKEYQKYEVENHRILCYYIMEKQLRRISEGSLEMNQR